MGVAVIAKFDHDPAAVHFVGDCTSGAGACEGVKDEIAGIGCDVENLFNQTLESDRIFV